MLKRIYKYKDKGVVMIRVGLNGFGRMGRLALRAAWDWPDFEIVHINEPAGEAAAAAHLLKYDSVHRAWHAEVRRSTLRDFRR